MEVHPAVCPTRGCYTVLVKTSVSVWTVQLKTTGSGACEVRLSTFLYEIQFRLEPRLVRISKRFIFLNLKADSFARLRTETLTLIGR